MMTLSICVLALMLGWMPANCPAENSDWAQTATKSTANEPQQEGALRRSLENILIPYPDITISSVDADKSFMVIRLNGTFGGLTDSECEAAGMLFRQICALDSGQMILLVEDSPVPSAVNPMDLSWARKLAATAGAPAGIHEADIAAEQSRVLEALGRRGIASLPQDDTLNRSNHDKHSKPQIRSPSFGKIF